MITLNEFDSIGFPAHHVQALVPAPLDLDVLCAALGDAGNLARVFEGPEAIAVLRKASGAMGRSLGDYVGGMRGSEFLARVWRVTTVARSHRQTVLRRMEAGLALIWVAASSYEHAQEIGRTLRLYGGSDLVFFDGPTLVHLDDREGEYASLDSSKLRAANALAHVAAGLRTNWEQMAERRRILSALTNDIDVVLRDCCDDADAVERWECLWDAHSQGVSALGAAAAMMSDGMSKPTVDEWDTVVAQALSLLPLRAELKQLGEDQLRGSDLAQWSRLWDGVEANVGLMMAYAKAIRLQLDAETGLDHGPDQLVDAILRHAPAGYGLSEVEQYADEYVEAVNAIRAETTGKRNLWDRFLDVLAGGTQQGPAERVRMSRWLEGIDD